MISYLYRLEGPFTLVHFVIVHSFLRSSCDLYWFCFCGCGALVGPLVCPHPPPYWFLHLAIAERHFVLSWCTAQLASWSCLYLVLSAKVCVLLLYLLISIAVIRR